jgi:hypothetical protein
MSSDLGGYVYQPIGMNLSVNPPMANMPIQYTPDGSVAPKFEDIACHNNETTTATISTRVEVLRINPVAFWIAASILIWIIITIIILASVQDMMRNVECIADMLVLIAGSERLLAVIREKSVDTILKEDKILTRLGWFRDADGTMRWRIELVEEEQVHMQPIRLGPEYMPVPDSSEQEDADTVSGPHTWYQASCLQALACELASLLTCSSQALHINLQASQAQEACLLSCLKLLNYTSYVRF